MTSSRWSSRTNNEKWHNKFDLTLRQKEETIDCLSETLQSRDQFKAEKELVEQNTKLSQEIIKYRKREHALKTQLLGGADPVITKRITNIENSDVTGLLINLDIKRNNLVRDIGDNEDGRRLTGSHNMFHRK